MSLAISLPGITQPVPISRAIVRWSDGGEFGIGLVALDARPAAQISEFFSTLTPAPLAGIAGV